MAQPTQVLPSWLSYSTQVVTDPAGALSTSVTVVQLPLTYYGPSIPLAPPWVYGGLTSPAAGAPSPTPPTPPITPGSASVTTTTTTFTTTTTSPGPTSTVIDTTTLITSATPPTSSASRSLSSSLSQSSHSATPQSSSPSTTFPSGASSSSGGASSATQPASASTPATASSSSSSSAPTVVVGNPQNRLSNGAVGGIVAGVVGFFLLLLLLLCCWRSLGRRRGGGRFRRTPIWTGWEWIGPGNHTPDNERRPGEGSPRHSGEEEDPFLRSSGAAGAAGRGEKNPNEDSPNSNRSAVWARNATTGEWVYLGSGTPPQHPQDSPTSVPAHRLSRLGAVPQEDEEGNALSPLLPPRRLDPDGLGIGLGLTTGAAETQTGDAASGNNNSARNSTPPPSSTGAPLEQKRSHDSSYSFLDADPEERAQLLTARRVRVNEYGSPSLAASPAQVVPSLPSSSASPATQGTATFASDPQHDVAGPSWGAALGLGGIARLGRLSWFRRMESRPTTGESLSSPTVEAPTPRTTRSPSRPSSWLTRAPSRSTSWYTRAARTEAAQNESRGMLADTAGSPPTSPISPSPQPPPSRRTSSRLGVQVPGTARGELGERPMSALSARSGRSNVSTVYLSAVESSVGSRQGSRQDSRDGSHGSRQGSHGSRQGSAGSRAATPSTPPQVPPAPQSAPPMPPMPVPAPAVVAQHSTPSRSHARAPPGAASPAISPYGGVPSDHPPAYDDELGAAYAARLALEHHGDVDVLDIPAPRPASPFYRFGTTATGSPTLPPALQLPPGLAVLPTPRVWADVGSSTPSPASGDSGLGSLGGHGITIDVLEEAPPQARDGWRSLADSYVRDPVRRATFGTPVLVHQRDLQGSEQGSLHSHLTPGSSPASESFSAANSPIRSVQQASFGSSASSRLQARFHTRSGSSLVHSTSISSDGRRRTRSTAGESHVSLSAVNPPSPRLPFAKSSTPPPISGLGLLDAVTESPSSAATGTQSTSSGVTERRMTDPATGMVMHFPSVPWSGDERDWPADAWTEVPDGTGAKWWGPPAHLTAARARTPPGHVYDDTTHVSYV